MSRNLSYRNRRIRAIRVITTGGLGNQLFAFNFAHLLREQTNRTIIITFCRDKNARGDRLNELSGLIRYCRHDIQIDESKIFSFLFKILDKLQYGNRFSRRVSYLLAKVLGVKDLGVDSEFCLLKNIQKARIYRGYYMHFSLINNLKLNWTQELKEFLLTLQFSFPFENGLYTALHYRRGDLLDAKIGILSNDYYGNIPLKFSDVVITSDSEILGEINNQFEYAYFASPSSYTPWQSFKILAFTKQLVIANSTFSWWAGILCDSSGGEVYAPDRWSNTNSVLDKALHNNKFIYQISRFQKTN